MIALISPAKKLDFNKFQAPVESTVPENLEQAGKIMHKLAKQSAKKLSSLMDISADLASLNFERNQEWNIEHNPENSKAALSVFNGDVYLGIQADDLSEQEWILANQQLRILSGLYGVLKPSDLIQPYRLEMGTAFSVGRKKNLYEIWKPVLYKQLNEELNGEPLLNLASIEYFKAVDQKKLKSPIINFEFKEEKEGKYKVFGYTAKRARGLMVRYMLKNHIAKAKELKNFQEENYQFNDSLSDENNWIFTRPKA